MDHPFLIAGLAYLAGHDAAVVREAAAREKAEIQALVDSVLAEDPEEQAEDEEVMGIIAATSGDHEAVTEEESEPTTKETSPDDTFHTIVGAVTILAFIVGWVLSGSFWMAVLSFCVVVLLFALIDKFRKPEP
jgi:predicted RND superfamily exporter protein